MYKSDKRVISKLEKTILKMKKNSSRQESEIQHYKKMAQSSNDDKRQHVDKHLNKGIGNDVHLYEMTGMNHEEFEWILERFKKTVENSSEIPRFSEYVNDPGNTCILTASQILLVTLPQA